MPRASGFRMGMLFGGMRWPSAFLLPLIVKSPFLQFRNGEPLTFAQAGATANRVANGLTELGVGKGHRVEALLKTPTQKVQKGKLRDAGPISSWPNSWLTRPEYRI